LLSEPEQALNSMQYVYLNKIDPRCVVCGRLFSTPFHITPPWPGPFLFASPEFLERGLFSQQFCQELSPQKKCVSIFFARTLHRHGPLLPAQEWRNDGSSEIALWPSTIGSIPYMFVLAGSETIFTQIT